MPLLPKILLGLYLLFLVAAGWRLFGIGWSRGVKGATGVALVLPVPLLFLLPALFGRDRPFSDILMGLGLTLLCCGTACLLGGLGAAWLRSRGR